VTQAALRHVVVPDATVIAFGSDKTRGVIRPAGVVDATGQPVPLAQCRRDSRTFITTPPPAATATTTLPGTWLFGGMLYAHFGHFLCESTGRLWGLDLPGERFDGVIFHPKVGDGKLAKLMEPTVPWLRVAGVDLPIAAPAAATRVERLVVPEQGFGTGDMIAGTPEYRAFVRAHFGAGVGAEGAENLYISRSRLYSKRGRILGEALLEQALTAEGYEIFHPQDHAIEVQIARYKAARRIISTDCSALHLAAFFARPDQQVAIIARRPGPTIREFTEQFAAFGDHAPLVVDALTALHTAEAARLAQMSEVYSEVDFPAIRQSLLDAGFLAGARPWAVPDRAMLQTELAALSDRLGAPIHPVPAG
jgi:capsular polysaccharide biosynthesis protein